MPRAKKSALVTDGRWVPKHSGAFYCSRACGGGCTWYAFQTATRRAEQTARQLGPRWTPRVWENLGWHWSVTCGPLSVHQRDQLDARRGWICYFQSKTALCPSISPASGRTAAAAVAAMRTIAFRVTSAFEREIRRVFDDSERRVKGHSRRR